MAGIKEVLFCKEKRSLACLVLPCKGSQVARALLVERMQTRALDDGLS